MINAAELASLQREDLRAMPDIATILRNAPVRTSGGYSQNFLRVTTHVVTPQIFALYPTLAPGTAPCRLTASVLSGGNEQDGAGEPVAIMSYTLTVPPGTDITAADRIQVGASIFEVNAVKGDASWNMSDAITMTKIN